MGSTTRGYPYPAPGDAPNGPLQIANLAQAVDADVDAVADVALGTANVFTPTLTASTSNPTLGTGNVAVGRWVRGIGGLIHYRFFLRFGTSSVATGNGNYLVSLPLPSNDGFGTSNVDATGSGIIRDNSATTSRPVTLVLNSSSSSVVFLYTDDGPVSAVAPWTWAASDYIAGTITYQG